MELHTLVVLIRAEFNEMPGLRLTMAQAPRLWTAERELCATAVEALLQSKFLRRAAGDTFMRAA